MSNQRHAPGGPDPPTEEKRSARSFDGSRNDDWSKTRASFLELLRDRENREAWEKFVDRYGPRIIQWGRKWFPHDAEDVAQTVFLKLVPEMKTFVYQPEKKFRGLLKKVTHNVMVDLWRERRREPRAIGGSDNQDALDRAAAEMDLEKRLAAEYDLELKEIAEEQVRLRVRNPLRWRAYVETEENLQTPAEVARELGIPVAQVYSASYDIKKMIQQTIAELRDPD